MIQRVIAFGIHAAGCLYAGYWAIFLGSVAFLIISSYIKERGHQPPARPVPHEMQQHHHKGGGQF